ncbi:unnamed protein product [Cochlearia groenlandica]
MKRAYPLVFSNTSIDESLGIVEDFLLKVGDCLILTDFVVMEGIDGRETPLILRTQFLATTEELESLLYGEEPRPKKVIGVDEVKEDAYTNGSKQWEEDMGHLVYGNEPLKVVEANSKVFEDKVVGAKNVNVKD